MKHYVFSEYCNISDDEKVYVVSVSSFHSTTVRAHWGITPLSKYLVNPMYNPFRPFGRRPTTPIKGTLRSPLKFPIRWQGPFCQVEASMNETKKRQEVLRLEAPCWKECQVRSSGSVWDLCVFCLKNPIWPLKFLEVIELVPKLTAGRSTQKAIVSPPSGVKCC